MGFLLRERRGLIHIHGQFVNLLVCARSCVGVCVCVGLVRWVGTWDVGSPRRTRGVTGSSAQNVQRSRPRRSTRSRWVVFRDLANKPQQFFSSLLARRTGLQRGIRS